MAKETRGMEIAKKAVERYPDDISCRIAYAEGAKYADFNPKSPWRNAHVERPSIGEHIIALTEGGNVSAMRYNENEEFERSFWLKYTMKDGGETKIEYTQTFKEAVTHWMPIPKKPQD